MELNEGTDGIRVTTKHGPVCGYFDGSEKQGCYRFKSIPYAKPPLGNLRFMPPVPIPPWSKEIDCTKDAPSPVSFNYMDAIIGSEDCLYIEIASPNIRPSKPMPVMFWIGDYSYTWHIDNQLDPSLLIEEGVVFVRCGYRLGPLGFLSLNEMRAPGNVGLKDLILALKWVQRNIDAFGGDPNNITLFGSSSGAIIVHLMMVSPMATGLFHKAIIHSGSSLNKWSIDPNPPQTAFELADELGINETDTIKVLENLKSIPAYEIFQAVQKINSRKVKLDIHFPNLLRATFKPCIELEFEGQSAFLTRSPYLILKSGKFNKVPLIIGSVNDEGSAWLCDADVDFYDYEKYNKNIEIVVPLSLSNRNNPTSVESIGHQLLDFYLGCDESLTKDTKTQFLQLISDYYFLYFVNKTVRMHSASAAECPVYYYIINCAGSWDVPKRLNWFNIQGHCVEMPFIFQLKSFEKDGPRFVKGSKDSVRTRSRLLKMWTNFAKYGNPTPDDEDPLLQITWDPVQKEKLNYLSIGQDLTKGRNPFLDRMTFWDNLFKNNNFLRATVYLQDIGVCF